MRYLMFAALAALFALPSSVNAGVINSLVQNEVVILEDTDFETAFDGGDGSLDVGDNLLAVVQFDRHRLFSDPTPNFIASPDSEAITAISLVTVETVGVLGSNATFSLTGASNADWLALTGLDIADGTAFVAYLDPVVTIPGDDHIVNDTIADGITSATSGDILFEFGVDNFFTATTTSLFGSPTDITQISDFTTRGDFELLVNHTGLTLLEHDALNLGFGGSQLQLDGGLDALGGSPGGFDIVTDTNVALFAVPEPTSALAFVGLFGLVQMRRRRRG